MWRETKILLIDDNAARRHELAIILSFLGEEHLACTSQDWRSAVAGLESSREVLSVLLGDVEAKGGALELTKQLAGWDEFLPLLTVGDVSIAEWPEDLRRRVLASLETPLSYNKLLDSLHRAQVYREMYDQARDRGRQREPNLFRSLVGTSRAIQQVRQMMQQVADTEASVLILGESGTGKEVVARNLHYHSKRREAPFVPVNCGAIPAELLESELFGHEKGAFTGAITSRAGRFELANGGTLFLDEIGDLPLPLQAKLLRVLQEQEVEPLGSNQVKPLNVRVIAATHIDLEAKVAAGQFRDDLYYRLNVLALRVPPLRERASDIPALIEHLLDDLANRSGLAPMELTDDALALLCAQPWKGNVRELRNLLERAQLAVDGRLDGEALRGLLVDPVTPSTPMPAAPVMMSTAQTLTEQLAQAERQALQAALAACDGNRQLAAERLGISRAGFYAKLAQHGLGRKG